MTRSPALIGLCGCTILCHSNRKIHLPQLSDALRILPRWTNARAPNGLACCDMRGSTSRSTSRCNDLSSAKAASTNAHLDFPNVLGDPHHQVIPVNRYVILILSIWRAQHG